MFTSFSNGNGSSSENSLDIGRISFRKRPCAMYKGNAVGNVVAETGRDLVFRTTARLSDLSMPLKGEVRRSPEQSARQPIARSGKFALGAYSRRALDCEKTTVLCFLPSWSQWRTQKGFWGVLPSEKFWIFRLKKCTVFKFRDTLPNVFSRLMLPVVVAQSYYSFTPAVCAFLQAPPLQGRKLVIGWKT